MTTSGANFPEQYNAQEMVHADNGDDINTLIATHLNLLGERLKEISRNIENVSFVTRHCSSKVTLRIPPLW